ncbi:LysR family transcriptional regulator [Streptomyces sp. NPDC007983]|uniref:LysR family transcriptional regulator n=1 Tax=Streptomyces sp. NPDC007983 TaxID=3364800 RepID=UPI0036ED5EA6
MRQHTFGASESGSTPSAEEVVSGAEEASSLLRRKIDINLMIPLHALLTEANVTRAAERTMVGQPAMSASLAKLRKHFGDPLLVRDGRTMALTPLGASLRGPVTRAIESIHAVMDSTSCFDPGLLDRTFTVVASDYISIVLLKPFLRTIADEAPRLRLNIVAPRDGMVPLVRRAQCDLLVAPGPLMPKEILSYRNRDLFTDELLVIADQDNDRIGETVGIDELHRLGYLEAIPRVLQESGPETPATSAGRILSGGYCSVAMHVVAGTRLVTLAQARLFSLIGPACGLRAVRLDAELPPLVHTMYWHHRHTADPAHIWLRDKLAEAAAALEPLGSVLAGLPHVRRPGAALTPRLAPPALGGM